MTQSIILHVFHNTLVWYAFVFSYLFICHDHFDKELEQIIYHLVHIQHTLCLASHKNHDCKRSFYERFVIRIIELQLTQFPSHFALTYRERINISLGYVRFSLKRQLCCCCWWCFALYQVVLPWHCIGCGLWFLITRRGKCVPVVHSI